MKLAAKTIIAVSALGMLNAMYLSYVYWQEKWGIAESGICDINASLSCSSVVSSPFAQFLGVPVCTIALVVYPVLITLAWLTLTRPKSRDLFYATSLLSAMGLMLNLVYIYNEFAYIKAIYVLCILCTVFIMIDPGMSIRGYAKSDG